MEINRYGTTIGRIVHGRLTVFRIGLIAAAMGSIWIGVVFSASAKNLESFNIDKTDSESMVLSLHGGGIGFYEIYSNQYNNSILVKVLDSHGNYLGMKTITNKETVNYFVFDHTGEYTLELTNLSSNPVQLAVEFGDTRYQEFGIPASMVLVGACLLLLAGYVRLKNYITAQPE
ncbi:MAG: hypothetical protein KGI27_08115 [Thaumarchaeota archaeon]|nr:hypothetical protein [Nitrososphaerota archaeon]